jgi:hypothetical protein
MGFWREVWESIKLIIHMIVDFIIFFPIYAILSFILWLAEKLRKWMREGDE